MKPSGAILIDILAHRPAGVPSSSGIDLSLKRINTALAALGHPERSLPPVIHVAGTNGKGSVIAFLRAMFEAAGRSVHVYTSPTLTTLHDQIIVAGIPISEAHLANCLFRIQAAIGTLSLTRFEAETAAAFLAFADVPADVVLLETGLGGRLDATNVVAKPALTVITQISRDHMAFLGSTVAEITGEKAGIMKPGVVCISGTQVDEARAVLEATARRVSAPLSLGGQDFRAYGERGRLVFQSEAQLMDLPMPQLLGRHQIENAGIAIAAALAYGDAGLDDRAISAGLSSVVWPGRLQALNGGIKMLLPPGYEVWVDGGHNTAAAEALATTMADFEDRSSKPLHLCVGMLDSKDPAEFLEAFADLAALVIAVPISATRLAHASAPGMSPMRIADAAVAAGLNTRLARDVCHALQLSVIEGERDVRLLFCGSLHLAGQLIGQDGDPGYV